MKIGFRIPSLKKRIAARTSWKRVVRHSLGFKAPRGLGWLTNPKKALYNRAYYRTTRGCMVNLSVLLGLSLSLLYAAATMVSCDDNGSSKSRRRSSGTYVSPSVDSRGRFRKGYYRNSVSSSTNSLKNQIRSRVYYETKGKYRRYNSRKRK